MDENINILFQEGEEEKEVKGEEEGRSEEGEEEEEVVIEKQGVGQVVIEEAEVEESMVIGAVETMIEVEVEVEIVREGEETVIEGAERLVIEVEEVVIEGGEVVIEAMIGEGEVGIMSLGEGRGARGRRKGKIHNR